MEHRRFVPRCRYNPNKGYPLGLGCPRCTVAWRRNEMVHITSILRLVCDRTIDCFQKKKKKLNRYEDYMLPRRRVRYMNCATIALAFSLFLHSHYIIITRVCALTVVYNIHYNCTEPLLRVHISIFVNRVSVCTEKTTCLLFLRRVYRIRTSYKNE
jgi:hypothetical protein